MRVTEKGRSVVEARGLGLTFETSDGPVHALSDVDLDIGKGEFVSFIGPSGCGKTTFLRGDHQRLRRRDRLAAARSQPRDGARL